MLRALTCRARAYTRVCQRGTQLLISHVARTLADQNTHIQEATLARKRRGKILWLMDALTRWLTYVLLDTSLFAPDLQPSTQPSRR